MKTIHLTTIQFPEIKLRTRDAHKLRGYFGNLFREHSPLLHNHYDDGKFRYRYPLVQYKVLSGVPALVALQEGADLLNKLFMKIKHLQIDANTFEIHTKNITSHKAVAGHTNDLKTYRFETLWMALNQENYRKYQLLKDDNEKQKMLNSILTGHMLSFFRNMNIQLEAHERLMVKLSLREKQTNFKDNKMLAFEGSFITNALLPDGIGLGKAVSRGFGTIKAV